MRGRGRCVQEWAGALWTLPWALERQRQKSLTLGRARFSPVLTTEGELSAHGAGCRHGQGLLAPSMALVPVL